MRLPKDGQEYVRVPIANYPAGTTVEASLDRTTWVPVTVQADGTALFLCRGPLSGQTQGTLVPAGSDVWIRVDGTPEQAVRRAGILTLY